MLLNPVALLLLAVSIPIVVLYVLKLRRRDLVVPSTILWQRALDDVQANTPWQRLRPNVLLLLQMAALAALVFALAQPAFTEARAFSGDLVVIVDTSYAMQARDVAPSRFDAALAQAHGYSSGLSAGSVMTVIGMGSQPQIASAESSDKDAINRSIDALTVGTSSPNYLAALSLAASLTRNSAVTRVIVLTSRDSGITGVPVRVRFPVTIVRFGGRLRDLAITDFRASAGGGTTQATLRVRNFGAAQAGSDVQMFADGNLVDVRPVVLRTGEERTLLWTHLPAGIRQLKALIVRPDDITIDKSAWAVLPTNSARKVLLVSFGNYFLQTALNLDPSVRLGLATPDVYSPRLAASYDLVVFDGYIPSQVPPISTLVVSPPRGRMGTLIFGRLRQGTPLSSRQTVTSADVSSILQYVDLSDVHVAQLRTATLPDSLQTLAISGNTVAIAAGTVGATRVAIVNFDLQRSDWPLRISFPVAIQNVLRYLAPGLALSTSMPAPGHPVTFYPEPGTTEIDVVRPDNSVDRLLPPFQPYSTTQQSGVYSAREIGGVSHSSLTFAVNVFHPLTAPASGRSTLTFGHVSGGHTHAVRSTTSVAWAFGFAALVVLAAEWWFAFKR